MPEQLAEDSSGQKRPEAARYAAGDSVATAAEPAEPEDWGGRGKTKEAGCQRRWCAA